MRNEAAQTLAAILETQPPELATSGKQVPAGLQDVISHCLEKNPQQRFHSAHDLGLALRATLGGSEPARPLAGKRFPLRWIAVGVAVPASEMLFEAVRFACAVAEETGGAFDPTVGHSMETRGFNREYRTGQVVQTALGGTIATTYWENERPVPVRLIFPVAEREDCTAHQDALVSRTVVC